ncbi:MAG: alpha-amylase family glycosyl hydrolase, partial [Pseudomonadota bacterium]
FADLTRELKSRHGLKTVLDVVCNHGSPSFSMPEDQPGYGELYGAGGELLADHQNLEPKDLDPDNPLHQWFHRERDLAELSNLDDTNPAVLDYMVGAYLKWIDQGAAALRIDTIRHMPHAYWKQFADRIREVDPSVFMFGERFQFDAEKLAEHMKLENGDISVLDFPGQAAMTQVFQNPDSSFADLTSYLHLADGVYDNPYKLAIFYDNHDMARMDATETGFINANNWLFTSRGFPVVYYGSEMAFMSGAAEHKGNRNYFGPERIAEAREGRIYRQLKRIAQVRRDSPALQRGLQVNLQFEGHQAAFLRVLQQDGVNQTALVLLNKGPETETFQLAEMVDAGNWRNATGGGTVRVNGDLEISVPAYGATVLTRDLPVQDEALKTALREAAGGIPRI